MSELRAYVKLLRLRCIDNQYPWRAEHLVVGREYYADSDDGNRLHYNLHHYGLHLRTRFKPIVRVPARTERVA